MAEFNAGRFFECHDVLEEMWAGHRGPGRDFFQGLIQVAVAFHHVGNGNLAGADSVFTRALGRLSRYPGRYGGFDLGEYRAAIERWRERVRAGDLEGVSLDDVPKWRFDLHGR